MIIDKFVEVTLNGQTIKYYESLGYDIPRFPAKWNKNVLSTPAGTKIIVKVKDLPLSSNIKVKYKCDYCGKIGYKIYSSLMKSRKIVVKDCCSKCQSIKTKETNLIKYGVEHTTQLVSTKEKLKETNLKKYGTEYPSQNKEIKKKIKNTFLEKYGETSPAKNEKIKQKAIHTNLKRYGATSPTLNEEIRQKQIKTLREHYGVDYPQQNKEIKKESMKSMYENESAPCSRQQKYIHNLLGGELNYPHGGAFLDIAFVENKIYLEVDLGGHKLQVKFGNISKKDYENKERNRWYALYRKGWKEIRFISSKDKIPSDKKIIEMFQFAKDYLNTDRHYIKFYLDEGKVKTSQFVQDYDFGELRYIYKQSLSNAI